VNLPFLFPGIPWPAPDVARLGESWRAVLVLPSDPRIPRNARLSYRRTADRHVLGALTWRMPSWQLQLIKVSLDAADQPTAAGVPPTLPEILDALAQLTAPGTLFTAILQAPDPTQPVQWPNPVMFGFSQMVVEVQPAAIPPHSH